MFDGRSSRFQQLENKRLLAGRHDGLWLFNLHAAELKSNGQFRLRAALEMAEHEQSRKKRAEMRRSGLAMALGAKLVQIWRDKAAAIQKRFRVFRIG